MYSLERQTVQEKAHRKIHRCWSSGYDRNLPDDDCLARQLYRFFDLPSATHETIPRETRLGNAEVHCRSGTLPGENVKPVRCHKQHTCDFHPLVHQIFLTLLCGVWLSCGKKLRTQCNEEYQEITMATKENSLDLYIAIYIYSYSYITRIHSALYIRGKQWNNRQTGSILIHISA